MNYSYTYHSKILVPVASPIVLYVPTKPLLY